MTACIPTAQPSVPTIAQQIAEASARLRATIPAGSAAEIEEAAGRLREFDLAVYGSPLNGAAPSIEQQIEAVVDAKILDDEHSGGAPLSLSERALMPELNFVHDDRVCPRCMRKHWGHVSVCDSCQGEERRGPR